MSRNQHWGEKKCQGHVQKAKSRRPWKRSVEKKTRQRGLRDLGRLVEDS